MSHLLPTIRPIFNTTRAPNCSGFLLDCVASFQTPRTASQGAWVRARESVRGRTAGRGMHAKDNRTGAIGQQKDGDIFDQ